MAEIESLEIKIEAQARNANSELDKLTKSLEKVSSALSKIDVSGIADLAVGLKSISYAMNGMQNSSRVMSEFAKNVNSIAKIDRASIDAAANSLNSIVRATNGFNGSDALAKSISSLVGAVGKLNGSNISSAAQNIPQLTNALQNMFNTLSTAPSISRSTTALINAIARLNNSYAQLERHSEQSGKTVSKSAKLANVAFSSLQNSVRSVSSGTGRLVRGFAALVNPMNKARDSGKSLAYYFGKLYASYFLVIRGIKALGRAVESSMDYVESYNYWSVSLGKIAKNWSHQFQMYGEDSAESYADSFSKRLKQLNQKMTGYQIGNAGELVSTGNIGLGLDPEQLMGFQARVLAVTNSVGLVGETSINTSKALSMLSADLSSLTNTDLDTVMSNLSSALIGQSRAAYKYGIDLTNASLQEIALAHGIEKKVSAMKQSEKMQLRLLGLMEQSKVAWGDQLLTINSVKLVAA